MQSAIDIGTLITRAPGVCGGRPRIVDTRVSVQRVAAWYKKGLSGEEIVDRIGNLTVTQVYVALAYYHANRKEIEVYLAAEQADYHRLADEMTRA